jgi:Mlc titration factor MtfA (ptsG expression regulator)
MYIFIFIVMLILSVYPVYKIIKQVQRKKLRALPVNPAWEKVFEKNLPIYLKLPDQLKTELHGHIQVLLHEKNFEGCGGLELNDEIRVTIAAQAGILLLNRKAKYYPKLSSILVYPSAYVAKNIRNRNGFVAESQVRLGESWTTGTVVLSWDDILRGAVDPKDGHNVVLHEFAHQLDQEDGVGDGTPVLPQYSRYISWAGVLGKEFDVLQKKASRGTKVLMDHYGATNPAEFFAVATETFFEKSRHLQRKHPELYDQLKEYYQMDPAAWTTKEM